MMRIRSAWLAGALVAVLGTLVLPVDAQPDPGADPGAAQQRAKDDFRSGTQLAGQGRWEEALAKLQASYDGLPSWQALYQVGVVLRRLGRHVESRDAFDLLIGEHGGRLSDGLRRKVAWLRAEETKHIAVLELVGLQGCTVTVGGREVAHEAEDPRMIELDPGPYPLEAECPDQPPFSRRIRALAAGERRSFEVVPRPPQPTAPPARPAPTGPPTQPPAPPAEDESIGSGPWVLVGVGGVLAIAGGILFGVGWDDKATVEDAAVGTRWSDVEAANGRAPVLSGVGISLLSTGVAAAGAGILWGLWAGGDDEETVGLRGAITPGGLVGYGRF